jgi:hypothetical protein
MIILRCIYLKEFNRLIAYYGGIPGVTWTIPLAPLSPISWNTMPLFGIVYHSCSRVGKWVNKISIMGDVWVGSCWEGWGTGGVMLMWVV